MTNEEIQDFYTYDPKKSRIEMPKHIWPKIADYHKLKGKDGIWYMTHYNPFSHGTDLVPVDFI